MPHKKSALVSEKCIRMEVFNPRQSVGQQQTVTLDVTVLGGEEEQPCSSLSRKKHEEETKIIKCLRSAQC